MIRYLFFFIAIWSSILTVGCDSSTTKAVASQPKTQESNKDAAQNSQSENFNKSVQPPKSDKESKPDKSTPVQVMTAKQQTISKTMELTGEVVAANKVVIRSNIDGTVIYCPWREGDSVKKGGRLVEIYRPIYKEEVNGAEAALAVARAKLADTMAGVRKEEIAQAMQNVRQFESCTFAKTDMERIEKLVKSGALPEEELEKARLAYIKCETGLSAAKEKHEMLKSGATPTDIAVQKALVKEAQSKLDMARAKLAESIITAPFDGIITKVDIREGDLATSKGAILSLMESASIVVRFSVPESYSNAVNRETSISAFFDALPNKEYSGKVVRLYPEIDSKTRTRTVEAKVDSSENLAPGMFARIDLATESSDKGVVIPDRAVLKTQSGEAVVFILKEDNTAEQRKIVTGIEAQGKIQVVSGLNQGEKFIASGNENLKNGSQVKVIKEGKEGKKQE
ncbi:MAG: efflux RND transporter periplasmic adaptor subunit [Desulfamplus sp.]